MNPAFNYVCNAFNSASVHINIKIYTNGYLHSYASWNWFKFLPFLDV